MLKDFLFAYTLLTLRYFVLAGGAYAYFWKLKKTQYQALRIQQEFPAPLAIRNEIKWSFLTFFIFASMVVLIKLLAENGYSLYYLEFSQYGWDQFFLSVVLMLVAHDTYFYFVHRLMHHKLIYKLVHSVHHRSTNPSPFAAFSFHPLEAVIEVSIVLIMIFAIPLHLYTIIIFLTLSTLINVIGHLGYELYPKAWLTHPLLKNLNFSTFHNCHHRYFVGNYGLYTSFWDRVFGTFKSQEDYQK